MDTIRAYADCVRRRFDLFDPVVPFYQVATLRSLSGGGFSRPRLAFALALVGRVKRQRDEALLGQALGEHHEAHPRAERRPH
jgi:hypothetical protein